MPVSAAPLLRHVIGESLRARRLEQQRTLREVSAAARVSLGYLSEVERGQKEASSELLAAICAALGVELAEVLDDVSLTLRLTSLTQSAATARIGPVRDSGAQVRVAAGAQVCAAA